MINDPNHPNPGPGNEVIHIADLMSRLSDPFRLQILLFLAEGERNATEIRAAVSYQISQPGISYHLSVLRLGNLIEPRRDGKSNVYRLSDTGRALAKTVRDIMEAWQYEDVHPDPDIGAAAENSDEEPAPKWLADEDFIIRSCYPRLMEWVAEGRPPAATYFTSGLLRFVAEFVEEQLAHQGRDDGEAARMVHVDVPHVRLDRLAEPFRPRTGDRGRGRGHREFSGAGHHGKVALRGGNLRLASVGAQRD